MASARDLITMFIGLELVSAPAFLLAGWRKGDLRSNEASLKFFLIGVLSSAILLFGMSLVYGTTGEITFAGIAAQSAVLGSDEPAFVLGVLFVLVGFGFKVAAVPFHFWAPDTYQGAPPPVAAYLSVGSKAAGFVGLLIICYSAFAAGPGHLGPDPVDPGRGLDDPRQPGSALRQTNVVRLLGYSSIAHAGFILVPFAMAASFDSGGLSDAFFGSLTYLLVYAFMNLGAFAAVIAVAERTGKRGDRRLGRPGAVRPGHCRTALGVLLLPGRDPATGGVVRQVRDVPGGARRLGSPWGIALAVVAAVNAVIALFFYARVVKGVYMDEVPISVPRSEAAEIPTAPSLVLAIAITAVVVIVVGFFPQVLAFFGEAARAFSG